jgi:protein phosphatase methylesterase 1
VPSLIREEKPPSDPSRPWVWRTNLAETKPFWEGWFIGLSKKFIEAKGGKLLLLAGTDRLDKELMIAQMQGKWLSFRAWCGTCPADDSVSAVGKYTLQVIPEAGHFIQEDVPSKTAQLLADFYKRNDRSALVLPPKVGDILAAKAMEKGIGADKNG